MPRKGHVAKPEVLPDPIYNSKLVTSLINHLMLDGKRGTASKILTKPLTKSRNKLVTTRSKCSNKQLKTSSRPLKLRRAGLVVLTTKCRSKFAQTVNGRWHFVGSCNTHVFVGNTRWWNVFLAKSSMLPTTLVLPSRRRKTPCGWPKLTGPSHTTAGKIAV